MVELREKILQLHALATKLKQKRVDNGALRLEVPKLIFNLDSQTGLPTGCTIFEVLLQLFHTSIILFQRKEAYSLVKEFKLLANMAVARRINEYYPDLALLRRQPSPKAKIMLEMVCHFQTILLETHDIEYIYF